MRILHIGKFYPLKGGMERVILNVVKYISEQGDTCDLLCVSSEIHGEYKLNEHAHVYAMHSDWKFDSLAFSFSLLAKLRKICKTYDIVHIHCPNPMGNIALYVSGYKGKVVLHWHSDILRQRFFLKLYNPLQSWLINRADVIVGTSEPYLMGSPFLRGKEKKFRTILLEREPVITLPERASAIKKRYAGKKIVFALGRLVSYKGFPFLVNAAKYLENDFMILIGGIGPLYNKLERQILDEGLSDKVKLLGFVPEEELADYYGACDVFCLSSIYKTEAFGMVMLEAMSCGKPIVATNIEGSGVPWVNQHGYSGLNVTPQDAHAIADAILQITKTEKVYSMFSQNSRKRYESIFTPQSVLPEYRKMYSELLNVASD